MEKRDPYSRYTSKISSYIDEQSHTHTHTSDPLTHRHIHNCGHAHDLVSVCKKLMLDFS